MKTNKCYTCEINRLDEDFPVNINDWNKNLVCIFEVENEKINILDVLINGDRWTQQILNKNNVNKFIKCLEKRRKQWKELTGEQ